MGVDLPSCILKRGLQQLFDGGVVVGHLQQAANRFSPLHGPGELAGQVLAVRCQHGSPQHPAALALRIDTHSLDSARRMRERPLLLPSTVPTTVACGSSCPNAAPTVQMSGSVNTIPRGVRHGAGATVTPSSNASAPGAAMDPSSAASCIRGRSGWTSPARKTEVR